MPQKKYWFAFLQYKYVDYAYNQAKQDLRHTVLKRKISQQSRSNDHMESYQIQVFLFMIAKHRGQEYQEVLHGILEDKLMRKI